MPYVSAYDAQFGAAGFKGGKGGVAGGGVIAGQSGGVIAGGGAAGAGCIGGPEVACGGAGVICCEAEGAVTSASWVYTGPGGSYNPTTNYEFVGLGSGSYDKQVTVTYYGWKFRQCCFIFLPLLLLIPLILLLIFILTPPEPPTSPDTQQVVVVPPQPPKDCLIYGDPHIKTFDSMFADYYSCGEYALVKSSTVIIQGKFQALPMTNGLAVTTQIAVGGAFLKGNKLIVGPTFVKWNTQLILTGFPSSFSNEFVSIEYNSVGDTLQKGRIGKPMRVLHIKFNGVPGGLFIQVNQWNEASEGSYINVRITMVPQPGQDGQCGNFNGNAADDDRLQVRARLGTQGVPAGEILFEGGKTPINPGTRPDVSNCPQAKLEHAKTLCKAKEGKWNPSKQCLIDVCFAGDVFAEEDIE